MDNTKKYLAILAVTVVSVVLTMAIFVKMKSPVVRVKGHELSLIIAKTEKDKQVGLSKYKSISDNKGMLFVFDTPGDYRFWMKDMKFPIDIIYIKDNKIVTIYPNVENPKSPNDDLPIYSPTESADKVLEVKSNLSSRYNLAVGDPVEFTNLK